jgi:hypothetical protein
MNEDVLTQLLFMGKVQEWPWSDLGMEVVYSAFPSGEESDIYRSVSGLDELAKERVLRYKLVAAVLVRVGGYAFKDLADREKFLRALPPPVLEVFVSRYYELRLFQNAEFAKALDLIKKSQPEPSPAPAGSSSNAAPT